MLIVFPVYMFLSIPGATLLYFQLVVFLSDDIAKHPGPGPICQNNFFNFTLWNLNSNAKDNFQRVNLIEAHNSLFKYDLISICESGFNDSVELPEPLLNEYIFWKLPHIQTCGNLLTIN